ncbi:MAG: hypothetical protein KBE16_05090 [Alphaproteobacteria bacterium]|jgi:hypothetical protein|nr:hypothetical protein [Alphaproteobacteria bacterium]MBP9877964.1 hypothetical protein [Alphaproteobacteria bacterium]
MTDKKVKVEKAKQKPLPPKSNLATPTRTDARAEALRANLRKRKEKQRSAGDN